MQKLSKSTQILDTVLKVLFWVMIARLAYDLYYYIRFLIFLLSDDFSGTGTVAGFTVGWLSIRCTTGLPYTREAAVWVNVFELISVTALMGLYCLAIRVLRHILKPMTMGKPFEKTISTDLKKLGWISLALCAADNIMDLGIVYIFEYGYPIRELLVGGNIQDIGFHYYFEPAFAIIAGVLFLLSYIFRYGSQLQQLSDETL